MDQGAIEQAEDGRWRIVPEQMGAAVDALSRDILTLQGDGDYDATVAFVEANGQMTPALQSSLDRLAEAGIPVDVVFEQGLGVLGLTAE